MPGPVALPPTERIGHMTRAEIEQHLEIRGRTLVIPEPSPAWHYIAKMLWQSHLSSAQTMLWQSSDWAILYLVCEAASRLFDDRLLGYNDEREDGVTLRIPIWGPAPLEPRDLNGIISNLEKLLSTAEARRRARVTITNDDLGEPPATSPADGAASNVVSIYSGVRGG
jgi:hypothetical protein